MIKLKNIVEEITNDNNKFYNNLIDMVNKAKNSDDIIAIIDKIKSSEDFKFIEDRRKNLKFRNYIQNFDDILEKLYDWESANGIEDEDFNSIISQLEDFKD